jgi:hypothetical protein
MPRVPRVRFRARPKRLADGELQRAAVVRTNGRLTVHTVQSMLCGAVRGWTTLTANRASVKAVLREVRARGYGAEARGGRGRTCCVVDR